MIFGPIGLLCQNLADIGAQIDEQWQLHAYGEPPVRVFDMPINHLVAHVHTIALNARTASAPSRTSYGDLQEVDRSVMRRAAKYLSNKADISILAHIHAAGEWNATNKHHIDEDEDPACPLCQAPNQTFAHIVCECPALQHVRDLYGSFLKDLPLEELPPAVLRGVAPAMHCDTSKTFWGQPATDYGCISAEAATHIGITNKFHTYGLLVDSAIAHYDSKYGARKSFANIRGVDYVPKHVVAPSVHGVAPSQPNIYTDGSMQHPKTKAYRLGGYAVWHPNRRAKPTRQPTNAKWILQ